MLGAYYVHAVKMSVDTVSRAGMCDGQRGGQTDRQKVCTALHASLSFNFVFGICRIDAEVVRHRERHCTASGT